MDKFHVLFVLISVKKVERLHLALVRYYLALETAAVSSLVLSHFVNGVVHVVVAELFCEFSKLQLSFAFSLLY